ncbi:MAG: hypothetical protein EOP50_10055, partial [Sphingobacteriales bacterium]
MRTLLITVFLLAAAAAGARSIEVGQGRAVSSIRQGITLARNGDTLRIFGGTYREGNIVLQKSITLLGVGGPLLDGQGRYEQLTLSGSNIRVSGLRFTGTGYSSMNDNAAIGIIDGTN